MKIYLLTDGDYSDYHIIGAFSSEEIANKAKKFCGGEIEEFDVDEIGKDNRFRFQVSVTDVPENETDRVRVWFSNSYEEINEVRRYKQYWKNGNFVYSVSVLAEDEEHAIKIASDLIAQYKAAH